jgi:hypothetical protein
LPYSKFIPDRKWVESSAFGSAKTTGFYQFWFYLMLPEHGRTRPCSLSVEVTKISVGAKILVEFNQVGTKIRLITTPTKLNSTRLAPKRA